MILSKKRKTKALIRCAGEISSEIVMKKAFSGQRLAIISTNFILHIF